MTTMEEGQQIHFNEELKKQWQILKSANLKLEPLKKVPLPTPELVTFLVHTEGQTESDAVKGIMSGLEKASPGFRANIRRFNDALWDIFYHNISWTKYCLIYQLIEHREIRFTGIGDIPICKIELNKRTPAQWMLQKGWMSKKGQVIGVFCPIWPIQIPTVQEVMMYGTEKDFTLQQPSTRSSAPKDRKSLSAGDDRELEEEQSGSVGQDPEGRGRSLQGDAGGRSGEDRKDPEILGRPLDEGLQKERVSSGQDPVVEEDDTPF